MFNPLVANGTDDPSFHGGTMGGSIFSAFQKLLADANGFFLVPPLHPR